MNYNTLLFILAIFIMPFSVAKAQEAPQNGPPPAGPPVLVEVMGGHTNSNFLMITSKRIGFSPTSRFGFFNIAYFSANYTDPAFNELLTAPQLTVGIIKGFSIAGGTSMNLATGFDPIAGLQYVFANQTFLVILAPNLYLNPDWSIESLALVEYKPRLSEKWGLYSRFQGYYKHNNVQGMHERSFINLRLGASFGAFDFGGALNLDWFGPYNFGVFSTNAGVFLKTQLF